MANETQGFARETMKRPMFVPQQLVFDKETSELVRIIDWPRRTFIVGTGEPAYIYRFDRGTDIRLHVRTQADMESGRFEPWINQPGVTPKLPLSSRYFPTDDLVDRIRGAIERVINGSWPMRVPAESTDPDLVLADCLQMVLSLKSDALCDVIAERQRQVKDLGYNHKHDDEHAAGELAAAASGYALDAGVRLSSPAYKGSVVPYMWPWRDEDWKPKDARSELVRAAALIVAEIERIDRAKARGGNLS